MTRTFYHKFSESYSPELTITLSILLFVGGVVLIEKGQEDKDESEQVQDSEEA